MSALFDLGPGRATPADDAARVGHVAAFMQRLALHGSAKVHAGSSHMADAAATYRALPETVRAALQVAAAAGCVVSIGRWTPKHEGPYGRVLRGASAVVHEPVPDAVAVALTLARFALKRRGKVARWEYAS